MQYVFDIELTAFFLGIVGIDHLGVEQTFDDRIRPGIVCVCPIRPIVCRIVLGHLINHIFEEFVQNLEEFGFR